MKVFLHQKLQKVVNLTLPSMDPLPPIVACQTDDSRSPEVGGNDPLYNGVVPEYSQQNMNIPTSKETYY